jgi:hypothetical protein
MKRLLITISTARCGHKNCIGIIRGNDEIIIEDVWTVNEKTLEESMVGLFSHETIEWVYYRLIDDDFDTSVSIHDFLGCKQKFDDYAGNTDGLVYSKRKLADNKKSLKINL